MRRGREKNDRQMSGGREFFLCKCPGGMVKVGIERDIILNASSTHTNWATAVKVVSKSVLIQRAEVHTKLCQLFDTFYIKDIIKGVFIQPYNRKLCSFEFRYGLGIFDFII